MVARRRSRRLPRTVLNCYVNKSGCIVNKNRNTPVEVKCKFVGLLADREHRAVRGELIGWKEFVEEFTICFIDCKLFVVE